MTYPAVLLFRSWWTNPLHAAAGVAGLVLLVWSVWPVTRMPAHSGWRDRTGLGSVADLFRDVEVTWQGRWVRASAGLAGLSLLVWSILPAASMR
jgi:hypothetical protein